MALYIQVKYKFLIVLIVASCWAALSVWVSLPWYEQLAEYIGMVASVYLITFIAIVPGFINAFVVSSLMMDKRQSIRADCIYPPITVLIVAYNKAGSIAATLTSLFKQQYPADIQIIVVNDGSTDNTAEVVSKIAQQRTNIKFIDIKKSIGKASALNCGLKECKTNFLITLDADTYLLNSAVHRIVGRYLSDPPNTRAVAGEVLIRNSRENWITKAQEWDYFLGIASIKRVQSLYQGTLVAQGTFSLYDRRTLVELGGWPDRVGEDIVLTWKLLQAGYRVGHAQNACAFTSAPNTFMKFFYQRKRWSRGVMEAFKENPKLPFKARMSTLYIWWNAMFPFMDIAFTVGFLPGLVLACFGKFWILGPILMSLLPLTILLTGVMYNRNKAMFEEESLEVRSNAFGLFFYIFAYGLLLQPVCLLGYIVELFSFSKVAQRSEEIAT